MMSDLGLAYQEFDIYETLFDKPKRTKRKKEPTQKFQLKLREVDPKTPNQQLAFQLFEQENNLVLHGMAGTGKTFITLYLALKRLFDKQGFQQKVVIVRSVVPTREMGFLPGSEREKMKTYEAPYQAMCNDLFGRGDAYEILKTKNQIEFISTSFIRGTTMDDCIIIVDEAQNLTFHELDSIITRVGVNSQIVFCGDCGQTDLDKPWDKCGLDQFMSILNHVDGFQKVEFSYDDIVRSGLVRDYLIAKDGFLNDELHPRGSTTNK
jgi:phosphate starvation-inducible PhoH-like protein/PhoH-like ATPase